MCSLIPKNFRNVQHCFASSIWRGGGGVKVRTAQFLRDRGLSEDLEPGVHRYYIIYLMVLQPLEKFDGITIVEIIAR